MFSHSEPLSVSIGVAAFLGYGSSPANMHLAEWRPAEREKIRLVTFTTVTSRKDHQFKKR